MEKRPTIDAAYSVIDITEHSEASARRDSNDGKKAYLGRRRLKENAIAPLRDSLQFSVKILGRDLSSPVKLPGSSASDSQRLELAERVKKGRTVGDSHRPLAQVSRPSPR